MDDPQTLWGSQASPLEMIMQELSTLQAFCHKQAWTDVHIRAWKIDICPDRVHTPVYLQTLLAAPAPDDPARAAGANGGESAFQGEREENRQSVYPHVHGIDNELVKQVIGLHDQGLNWSKIAIHLGKNYGRTIKPIKEAVENSKK